MTLKECYAELGGNYDAVIGRLRSERIVQKFVLKFPADGSFKLLHSSLDAGDYQEAFRAAHTIKGVCQNLGFDKLYESSHELTESLRNGLSPETEGWLSKVDSDYKTTIDAIERFQTSQ